MPARGQPPHRTRTGPRTAPAFGATPAPGTTPTFGATPAPGANAAFGGAGPNPAGANPAATGAAGPALFDLAGTVLGRGPASGAGEAALPGGPGAAGPVPAAGTVPAAAAGTVPGAGLVPADARTRAQKLLDGLVAAVQAGLRSGRLPRNGGVRPQVVVAIDYRTLAGELADPGLMVSEAALGGTVHPNAIRRLACGADLIPVVLGTAGQVLDAGRAARLFSEDQHRVLYARDRGCTAPGCTVPAAGCEAHHVRWWSRGGGTDVGNGALCCPFHHHLAHEEDWEIRMVAGVPHWIPPAHVDPARRPLRNTYFHPGIG